MRNRYLVSMVMALLIGIAGCSKNPDAAKKKYLESGMKYMEQQKYDSAIIQFRKAIQIDPKYAEAHYELAEADLKLTHNQDAFREMSQVVELDPNHYKARVALGGMFLASGSHFYPNAEEQARYVTEHDPNNPEGYVLLGNVLLAQKHYEDALASFSKAIAIKPSEPSAYMNRGAVYVFMKQDDAAEKDFKKAVELDPHSLAAYANLAGYYMYKKDPKKAEEVYRDEMANNPDSPAPYLRLAGLMLREGRKDEGEAIVQQLRSKQPSSAEVASAIGDFYLSAPNTDAPLKEYQRGLSYDPKNETLQVRIHETI